MSRKSCLVPIEYEMEIDRVLEGYRNETYAVDPTEAYMGEPDPMSIRVIRHGQPRLWSLYEATANTIIGYALALIGQVYIYNAYQIHVTLEQNLVIGVFFMAISLARSYILRRVFNELRRSR